MHGPGSGVAEAIWVLSFSVEAMDRVTSGLMAPSVPWPRAVVFECTAFGGPERPQRDVGKAPWHPRLRAAVLILERKGLGDAGYRRWIEWAIAQVACREVFRLYVLLDGMTLEEFDRLASPGGDDVLARLRDTVQVTTAEQVEALRAHLLGYLERLDDLRDRALLRRLGQLATGVLGVLASAAQLACMAGIFAAGAALLSGPTPGLASRVADAKVAVALMLGLIGVPLALVLVFLVMNPEASSDRKKPKLFSFLGLIVIVTALTSFGVYRALRPPWDWVVLGAVAGLFVDGARRRARRARRTLYPVDCTRVARPGQGLPKLVRSGIRAGAINPLHAPLISSDVPRVFLSYTRSSTWGRELARSLHRELTSAGTVVYFDRDGIDEGSPWRHWMNEGVGRCNVFLALVDPISATREWTAAELEAGLVGRALTGEPEVVILEQVEAKIGPRLPVFDAVLNPDEGVTLSRLRVAGGTLLTLVGQLRRDRYLSPAVLPGDVQGMIYALTAPWKVFLVWLGTMGTPAGLIAGALALLGCWMPLDVSRRLWAAGPLAPGAWLGGFWLGFEARMMVAARFEATNRGVRRPAFFACALASLGLVSLLLPGLGTAPRLAVSWSMVSAWLGWVMGESCVSRISSLGEEGVFRLVE
jgi:TIR domain